MSELLTFFNDHVFLAFCFICACYYSIKLLVFILPNGLFRCINIYKNGYPPAHCDADGDFKQKDS